MQRDSYNARHTTPSGLQHHTARSLQSHAAGRKPSRHSSKEIVPSDPRNETTTARTSLRDDTVREKLNLMPPSPDLLHLLRDCYANQRNIVDAGLIQSATLTPDPDAPGTSIPGLPPRHLARITLHAPGSDETANLQLVAQIENRLLGLPSISRVEVTLLPALFPIL